MPSAGTPPTPDPSTEQEPPARVDAPNGSSQPGYSTPEADGKWSESADPRSAKRATKAAEAPMVLVPTHRMLMPGGSQLRARKHHAPQAEVLHEEPLLTPQQQFYVLGLAGMAAIPICVGVGGLLGLWLAL